MAAPWPRRAEFVNMVLAYGVGRYLNRDEVKYDGIAGEQFNRIADPPTIPRPEHANDLIDMALQTGAPVVGLEADGVLGEKWDEVVALAMDL